MASAYPKLDSLIADVSREDARIVPLYAEIVAEARKANLLYSRRIVSSHVGVHRKNREGAMISGLQAMKLWDEIDRVGVCPDLFSDATAFEEPRSRINEAAFLERCKGDSNLRKYNPGDIEVSSVACSHWNQAIGAAEAGLVSMLIMENIMLSTLCVAWIAVFVFALFPFSGRCDLVAMSSLHSAPVVFTSSIHYAICLHCRVQASVSINMVHANENLTIDGKLNVSKIVSQHPLMKPIFETGMMWTVFKSEAEEIWPQLPDIAQRALNAKFSVQQGQDCFQVFFRSCMSWLSNAGAGKADRNMWDNVEKWSGIQWEIVGLNCVSFLRFGSKPRYSDESPVVGCMQSPVVG